jgi:hypothetical protein
MFTDKKGWSEIQVDEDNMSVGEITIEDWILSQDIPTDMVEWRKSSFLMLGNTG